MTSVTSIVSLLTKRVSEGVGFPATEQSKETEIVEHLYTTIQNFISCSSYTIENDVTLDYEDIFDYSSDNASDENEPDEEIDPSFSEDEDDKFILNKFSLDYMQKVLNYYDEVDEKGNRKHSWRSINHRFKRVTDSTYLTRFRKYVNQNGTKNNRNSTLLNLQFILLLRMLELNHLLSMIVICRDGLDKKLENFLSIILQLLHTGFFVSNDVITLSLGKLPN